jgi:hypothetical protein
VVSQLLLPAKEDVQDIVFGHLPVFALPLEGQVLFERGSTLHPSGFEVKTSTNLVPEALNQSICKRGHLLRPDLLDTNSSQAQQHCRLDSPIAILTLEMCEPVCEAVAQ